MDNMPTFHELLEQYYAARKELEEYAKPRIDKLKKGVNIPEHESEFLESLSNTVKDFENKLYSYRGSAE